MKKLSILLILCLIVTCLTSCGKKMDDTTDDAHSDTDVIIEEPIEIIEPEKLVCLLINDLRLRDEPNGNIIQQYGQTVYAPQRCYTYYEEKTVDDYRWFKIADNTWFGTQPDWIIESRLGENNNLVDTSLEYYEPNNWGPTIFSVEKELQQVLEGLGVQDETSISLMKFLRLALPGLKVADSKLFDFDTNKLEALTTEQLQALAYQLFESGSYHHLDVDRYKVVEQKYMDMYSQLYGADQADFLYGGIKVLFEEDVLYTTQKYYGVPIDLRIGFDYYDPETNSFIAVSPTGYGCYEDIPYIIDYEVADNIITAKVAILPLNACQLDELSFGMVDENYKWLDFSLDELDSFIETRAEKAEVTIKILENGDYQLVSVEKL